jgi:hypothetical protein
MECLMQPPSTSLRIEKLDRMAIATAIACALHCALMPLLPLIGLGLVANEQSETLLLGMALAGGIASLFPSYIRRHQQLHPLLLFGLGAGLILAVRSWFEDKMHIEMPVAVLGALLIAAAHRLNLRLCRTCRECDRNPFSQT